MRRLLPFVGFVALLVSVEGAVWLTIPYYPSRNFFLTLFGDLPDETPEERRPLFEGDPVLFWRLRPNVQSTIWDYTVVSTNAQGLRERRPVGHKPRGTFRIVCVGDSVTFGYRIPLVFPDAPEVYDHEERPYPGQIEQILRARFPGRDIEVITLAVPGYSTHQGLLLLERTIGWLDPDVVVICFGFNDVARKSQPDAVVMGRGIVDTSLRTLMASSQTLLHVWKWCASRPHVSNPPPQPGPRVPQASYVKNIEDMIELAHQHGAKVLVVGPVYRDDLTNPPEAQLMAGHRAALRTRMAEIGLPYLQIDELTEAGHPKNAQLFGELIHPSSMGHELMAKHIHAALSNHRLLAKLEDAASGPP